MRQTENSLQLREIEKRIGYEFKDKSLPETAFTHSSYANERKLRSNENMEFFGDAILEFLVSEYLYKNFPDKNEGDFSRARAAVVSRDSLFLAVKKMGLEEFLLISNAQALATENSKIKLFANLFEAVLCAVYLDGGLSAAEKFVFSHLKPSLSAGSRGRRLRKRFQAYSFGILSVRPHRAGIYGRGKKRTSAQSALCLCGERQRRAVGQRRGRL